jgi:hypothetical protein
VAKVTNISITGLQLQLSLFRGRGSGELVEKVGMSNTGIVKLAIRLRCFRKHKLKDPKGKEEETQDRFRQGSSLLLLMTGSITVSHC